MHVVQSNMPILYILHISYHVIADAAYFTSHDCCCSLPISRLRMEELLLAEVQDLVEAHTDVTKADKSCIIKCLTGMATFVSTISIKFC